MSCIELFHGRYIAIKADIFFNATLSKCCIKGLILPTKISETSLPRDHGMDT